MSADIGKISPEVFDSLILPRLGAHRPEVAVGPQHGVDVGIIEIGPYALALTSDPVFVVPAYGFERSAWFAIHILASDAVTSGLAPAFLSIDLNLPMEMSAAELETMWQVIHQECEKMNTAIVCGHTGRYENCSYPMIGGATFIAMGSREGYCTPRFCRPGDRIIITKGPAIEATGIFAAMFPKYIEQELGGDLRREAEKLFYQMSVVEDALAAAAVGTRDKGVSAMHDATECGIWGGLVEIARASGLGLVVHEDEIVVSPAAEAVCRLFSIDPYSSISEGTLIACVRPHAADEIVARLADAEIPASVCGELLEAGRGVSVVREGHARDLVHPRVDPFWEAFYRSIEKGLS